MRISAAFPSTYLKAADLQGKNVNVVIERIEIEEVGDGHKPVVYFQGKEKGVVLNKTNANNIASAYGDDTDDWIGAEIVLFPAMVDFQGRSVEAIRVRVPPRRPVAANKPSVAAGSMNPKHTEIDPPPPTDSDIRF